MKKESTIKKEISRLRKIVDDSFTSNRMRQEAYEVEQALRWVIFNNCEWTPSSLMREY